MGAIVVAVSDPFFLSFQRAGHPDPEHASTPVGALICLGGPDTHYAVLVLVVSVDATSAIIHRPTPSLSLVSVRFLFDLFLGLIDEIFASLHLTSSCVLLLRHHAYPHFISFHDHPLISASRELLYTIA